jgi:lipopolysaccharide export system permease protein
VAAFLIGVATVTGFNPLATELNSQFEQTRAELMEGYLQDQPEEVWLSQGAGRTQVILHARDRNELGTSLNDVTVRVYTRDANGGLTFDRRIDARRADLAEGAWILTDARVAIGGAPAVETPRMSIPTTFDARTVLERFASPETVSFWQLPDRIERTEAAGLSTLRYRLQYAQLLATPLMYAAMSILAAAFSLRLIRLGGIAKLAGSAVALGFVFFFFNELCAAMGTAELLPPWAAAWAPPTLAFLAGLTLLTFTEDG